MAKWKWMRFHKAQKETVARSGENIGTMLIGGLLLQWFLGTGHVDTNSIILAVLAAVGFYGIAIWLRRDNA